MKFNNRIIDVTWAFGLTAVVAGSYLTCSYLGKRDHDRIVRLADRSFQLRIIYDKNRDGRITEP